MGRDNDTVHKMVVGRRVWYRPVKIVGLYNEKALILRCLWFWPGIQCLVYMYQQMVHHILYTALGEGLGKSGRDSLGFLHIRPGHFQSECILIDCLGECWVSNG